MKKKTKKQQTRDIFKVLKADRRSAEIAEHGKPLRIGSLSRNKKLYKRHKKHKKDNLE